MKPPKPAPSVIAEAARAALEIVLADGAVAVLITYEDRNRTKGEICVPNLESIRLGLLAWPGEDSITPQQAANQG